MAGESPLPGIKLVALTLKSRSIHEMRPFGRDNNGTELIEPFLPFTRDLWTSDLNQHDRLHDRFKQVFNVKAKVSAFSCYIMRRKVQFSNQVER